MAASEDLDLVTRQDLAEKKLLAALQTERGQQVLKEEAARYHGDTRKATASMVFYARQEVEKLHRKRLFDELGKTSTTGFLTVRELVHMSSMNGLPKLTPPQALALLNKFDTEWQGGLNFDEFSQMLEHVQKHGAEEFVSPIVKRHRESVRAMDKQKTAALHKMFAKYDITGCGSITPEDLVRASHDFHGPGAGLTLAEAQAVVKEYDVDGDNTLGIEEFKAYFKKQANARKSRRQQRKNRRGARRKNKRAEAAPVVEVREQPSAELKSLPCASAPTVMPRTEPSQEELQDSFKALAEDGKISAEALVKLSSIKGNVPLTAEKAQQVLKKFSGDSSDAISWQEFYQYWLSSMEQRASKHPNPEAVAAASEGSAKAESKPEEEEELTEEDKEALEYERITAAFDEYDTNGDGNVNVQELAKMLERVEGRPVSLKEAKFHVDRFDVDHDEALDIEEFLQFMHSRRGMRKKGALLAFDNKSSDEEEVEDENEETEAPPPVPSVKVDWTVEDLRMRAKILLREQEALNKDLGHADEENEDDETDDLASPAKAATAEDEESEAEQPKPEKSLLNARIKVTSKFAMGEEGIVKFVGETSFAPGTWVGVELKKAVGKNDGSVKGVKYFPCKPKHGIFLKETMLKVLQRTKSAKSKHKASRKKSSSRAASAPTLKRKPSNAGTKARRPSGQKSVKGKSHRAPRLSNGKARSPGLVSKGSKGKIIGASKSKSPKSPRHATSLRNKPKSARPVRRAPTSDGLVSSGKPKRSSSKSALTTDDK